MIRSKLIGGRGAKGGKVGADNGGELEGGGVIIVGLLLEGARVGVGTFEISVIFAPIPS
jgi:hypothetical protein